MTTKKQTQPKAGGDYINITVGDNASYLALGKDVHQQINVSAADLEEVARLFDELKRQIEQQAPPDKKAAALERVDELQQEVTSKKPDPATFSYVWSWFGKNLPTLLGSVTALLVNPLVGKVVEAASTMASDAIKAQFKPKS